MTSLVWFPVAVWRKGLPRTALVMLGLLLLAGCGCQVERRQVAIPPSDASPEQVVRTWFDAITGRDEKTARALMAPGDDLRLEFEDPYGPFQNWTSVSDVRVGRLEQDKDCLRGETCVQTYVSFDLCVCEEQTETDGPWGQTFGLRRVGNRWLIYGHGLG